METDCPYLAPVPHRGKRNEPAFVVEMVRASGGGARRARRRRSPKPPRAISSGCVCGAGPLTGKLVNYMNLGKLGQALTAREIFDLIQDDLEQVEKKIGAESVASADAVTAIGQYLQSAAASGCGRRCCCFPPSWPARTAAGQRHGHPSGRGGGADPRRHAGARRRDRRRRRRAAAALRPTSSGATTPACWRATGSTCRPSRSPCASAISRFSTC